MLSPIQATYAQVYDQGLVRLSELGSLWLDLAAADQPVEQIEQSLLDLRGGLEAYSLTRDRRKLLTILAYVQETYGLPTVAVDPLLRPLLPVLPAAGSRVRRFFLGVNGRALLANTKAIGLGVALVAIEGPPVYNTDFSPGQTIGAVTYVGVAGDVFSMDMPVDASIDLPQFVRLLIGGIQVARIDFPPTAAGAGFSLLHLGEPYYGVLQVTDDNTITLSL